jgi:hypothetical protein
MPRIGASIAPSETTASSAMIAMVAGLSARLRARVGGALPVPVPRFDLSSTARPDALCNV